jgi:phage terminase Nu1 subunit (DNA packaging protein)
MAQALNRQQVAKLLMLTPQRINQLVKQGVVPKDGHGKYELVGAVQGYISFLRENALHGVKGVLTISESKQRKLAAEAKMAELQLDLERKEVVRISYVEPQWTSLVTAMKTKLLGMPNKLTPLLVSQDNFNMVNRLLSDAIAEALNELAKGREVELVQPSSVGDESRDSIEGSTDS